MPEVHAKLSASGASRWINCPPSVALESNFPDKPSQFAEEGTWAHAIAEKKLLKYINKSRKKIPCEDKEMDEYTDQYKDYCVEVYNKLRKKCKDTVFLVEQRLDFSTHVPGGFGTGDCVLISDSEIHVIDLKYGKGVEVSAQDNPQLRLYGLGACNSFELLYDFDTVVVHIMQPRLDNVDSESISVKDLKAWANDVVVPAAQLADKGEGEFKCGSHCKFCKAYAACKTQKEHNMSLLKFNYGDPNLMSLEDMQEVLAKVDDLKRWSESVKSYALDRILDGHEIPGYKAVEGRSNRIITDTEKVAALLQAEGFDEAMIYKPQELLALGGLEKLVGKTDFAKLAKDYITKPEGKPTLALESDKRKSITRNDAQDDFKDLLK